MRRYFIRVIFMFVFLFSFAIFHWFTKDHEKLDIEENRFMKNEKNQNHDRKWLDLTGGNKTLLKDGVLVWKNNITSVRRSKRIVSKRLVFFSRNMYNY